MNGKLFQCSSDIRPVCFPRIHPQQFKYKYSDRHLTGVSLASLYCDKATRAALKILVTEFFDTVQRVTGKNLQFHLFNPEAKLRCLVFDAEAAQMQGCGDAILPMNVPEISGITTQDHLLIGIAKTCVQHFNR
jgi:hypothetical protein